MNITKSKGQGIRDNKWSALKIELEVAVISLMPFKDKISKATLKAYQNVQQCMKTIEEREMKSEGLERD